VIAGLPRLHAVTDDRLAARPDLVERAAAMATAGGAAFAVHLRSRALTGAAFHAAARALADALGAQGSWLVINDRADIARAVRANALVLPQSGLTVQDARHVAPGAAIGRSVHDAAEARAAAQEQADFLVAGAVYATASHPDQAPAGLTVVRDAAATGLPVIAIGGITPPRTAEVLAAGAHGVAAIRALWDAPDPAAAVRAFLALLPVEASVRVVINGESRRARRGITLRDLLGDLSLDPRAVVVEHNRRIVRRDDLASAAVAEGDHIELVHFVGGG
jgi:thiamine-phosphate pyrophosphorylase